MAVMNIEQVNADMPLSPLYIIHGEEDLLRIETLDTLRAAAKKQGYLNREVFTADNGALDDLFKYFIGFYRPVCVLLLSGQSVKGGISRYGLGHATKRRL